MEFRDVQGNRVTSYRREGHLYDTYGNRVYEILGDRIYGTARNWLGERW